MFADLEASSQLPDSFFQRLLAEIDSAEELKVTVYALWRTAKMVPTFPGLAETEFEPRELGLNADQLRAGLDAAVQRGSLLRSAHGEQVIYFVNSPQGATAARDFAQRGRPDLSTHGSAPLERPNVFRAYEQNIGPLTPMIADALKDAEATYTVEWVTDAIELAVKHNKRSWKYAEAILKRWKEEGRAQEQSGRDDQASRQRDVEDKIKKFVGRAG